MISSSHLNKLFILVILFINITFSFSLAEEEPVDIWKQNEVDEKKENLDEKKITIESPILSDDVEKIVIKINEDTIENNDSSVIGIFDPQENNFNLNMWSNTDGEDIKKTLKRIGKLKLSKPSEDLLYQVLFTNSYPPQKNLSSKEFLNIKIKWLIEKNRIEDLENLLKGNPEVGSNSVAVNFLINEYISTANIKSACNKINFIDSKNDNYYLEKFKIYCLIHNERKEEAQLIFDLLKESGMKDKFFENKISFLLDLTDQTDQKILDDNLLNFYFSYITSENFDYVPSDKTNKYIWRYLSSANLIQIDDLENEDILITYEKAAAEDSFEKDEIFKIYLKMNFNFNQLVNVEEIYKNLPGYKARGLVYQTILLSDNIEKKIYLAFLLKDLFKKDNLSNVYNEELSNILKSIKLEEIPDDYAELVKENLETNASTKVKFDNDIIHRSKIIKHFLENNDKAAKTEKDLKSVYKKIKRNKKYFISIKDIIVLEALEADGISLPEGLKYKQLSSELTVPKNLEELVNQKQLGLVMLKIVEIIGEDKISNLDPETIYFLNKILNNLNLKKIRNNILSEALPVRI